MRIALVAIYLAGTVAGVIGMDVESGGSLALAWLAASILLGAGTGDYRCVSLALLAIPIAIPFGLPADTSSDPVLPTWVGVLYLLPFSAAMIALGALARNFAGSRLRRRRSRRDAGIA